MNLFGVVGSRPRPRGPGTRADAGEWRDVGSENAKIAPQALCGGGQLLHTCVARAAMEIWSAAEGATGLDTSCEVVAEEGVPPLAEGAAQLEEEQELLSLGDIEEVEVLLAICSHVSNPKDLGRLACVSRAFGTPVDSTVAEGRAPLDGRRMPLKAMTYMDLKRKAIAMGVTQDEIPAGKDDLIKILLLSVVEESARRWVLGRQPKGRVVPRDSKSWLRRMYEIQVSPTRFVQAAEQVIALSDNGAVATVTARYTSRFRTAASSLLVGDKHYAVFTIERGCNLYVGVVTERCDVRHGSMAHDNVGNCFICVTSGKCYPGNSDWLGRRPIKEGDRVGLLLDTTDGTLGVFVNRVFCGVMMESGLRGRYRWAVSMFAADQRVRFEPGPVLT